MSAVDRHSQEGTCVSSRRFRRVGTPALRKYFCARMSAATWLQCSGTAKSWRLNTTEPSGFLISEVARRKGIFSYGDLPAVVKRRLICIGAPLRGWGAYAYT